MELAHRSREPTTVPVYGTASADQVPVEEVDSRRDAQCQKCTPQVANFESDHDQVQERWHRDPFGRDNNQSRTKAIENQKNLEEAMYNEGFSRVRASKIAFYMTRCEGQFQEWDFVVKKQPRLRNRIIQGENVVDPETEIVQGQGEHALNEDGKEDEIGEDDSDRDGSETTSVIEGGRQRLRELKLAVSGRVHPAKAARKARSHKDERQRKRDRKSEALRIKEYASYTYDDYLQAARRYDIVYGSADKLYQLAEDRKATCLIQSQRTSNQPTTEMMIGGHQVDVEDPTFGLTQPSLEEALTQDERRTRDQQNKQLWARTQREVLIRSLEKQDLLQSNTMSK
jgi:hypothetical protein